MREKQEKELVDLLKGDTLCNKGIKTISPIIDKYYKEGDEIDFKSVIKKTIHCIPLNVFRYLMLYVAGKEIKMKIYAYAILKERLDLLPSIKGLTSKDYKLVSKYYEDISSKREDIKELLVKEINKAIKKEKSKEQLKDEKKYYAVQRHRSMKSKSSK